MKKTHLANTILGTISCWLLISCKAIYGPISAITPAPVILYPPDDNGGYLIQAEAFKGPGWHDDEDFRYLRYNLYTATQTTHFRVALGLSEQSGSIRVKYADSLNGHYNFTQVGLITSFGFSVPVKNGKFGVEFQPTAYLSSGSYSRFLDSLSTSSAAGLYQPVLAPGLDWHTKFFVQATLPDQAEGNIYVSASNGNNSAEEEKNSFIINTSPHRLSLGFSYFRKPFGGFIEYLFVKHIRLGISYQF